uniref:Uncharacterized protein n=1 Tax=Romanomermis culicivorax TaxID=13658 RepID=A0A915KAJ7_ROMCU
VTGKFRSGFNPFVGTFYGNVLSTLCSPLYPSYLNIKNRQSYPPTFRRPTSTAPDDDGDKNGDVMIELSKVGFNSRRGVGGDKDDQKRKLLNDQSLGGGGRRSHWTTVRRRFFF